MIYHILCIIYICIYIYINGHICTYEVYMESYNKYKPSKCIIYKDVNNMYEWWVMSQNPFWCV